MLRKVPLLGIFLSTLSLRRATTNRCTTIPDFRYFYPRSPCGERHTTQQTKQAYQVFLSTLSLRRATIRNPEAVSKYMIFLSTLSLRRATSNGATHYSYIRISIHALLAESDCAFTSLFGVFLNDFYPRSPCGERRDWFFTGTLGPKFLSTLSLRRATRSGAGCLICLLYFYPRSPCGERQCL